MKARVVVAGVAAVAAAGCQSFPDAPVTFVTGLRVLAMKAEPPAADPGEATSVSILAVDTSGGSIEARWTACLVAPLPGQAVNADCVDGRAGADIRPVGEGLIVTTTMPDVSAEDLGAPDASGGVYLPLVAEVSSGQDIVHAVYRLRLGSAGQPANANPKIAEVIVQGSAGASTPLDGASATPVDVGDSLALGVTFAPGSAESYTALDGTPTSEVLTTSWFSTAGTLSFEKTSETQPQTVLRLVDRLPAAGSTIDLWAVARDERGGADYVHRTLVLR